MKVTVSGRSLKWPQRCAACCEVPTTSINAKCVVGKSAIPLPGFILVRSNILTVQYPICRKHKLAAIVFGLLSQRNKINLGLGVLSVFCLVGLVGGIYRLMAGLPQQEDSMPLIYWAVLPILYWVMFYIAKKLTPVKITGFKNESLSFEFSNDQYGEEFSQKNS